VEPGRRALAAEVGEKVEAMTGRRGRRGMEVCVEGAGEEGIGDKPGEGPAQRSRRDAAIGGCQLLD
jgi:hypothetical protein